MKKVGYVSDDGMAKHKCLSNLKHPEQPDRIRIPMKMLQESGTLDKCIEIKSRSATEEELQLVHTADHIATVRGYTSAGDGICRLEEQWKTYTSPDTYSAATLAVGCLLSMTDALYSDQIETGVAIVRPPGHHAEVDETCGFCYFNNIAIAAKYAQQKHGAKKVLILDWDIHHGNGIQHIFYNDPSVLYVSLHRFDQGDYFPQLREANYNFCGEGKGEGYTVNIPWNKDQMSNAEYEAAFRRIVLPIVRQFRPDLALVASGFDAAAADLLGEYVLTPGMYGYMTRQLVQALQPNTKVLLALEGGYNCTAIGEALHSCVSALLGEEGAGDGDGEGEGPGAGAGAGLEPCKRAQQTIAAVVETQSKYWKLK